MVNMKMLTTFVIVGLFLYCWKQERDIEALRGELGL